MLTLPARNVHNNVNFIISGTFVSAYIYYYLGYFGIYGECIYCPRVHILFLCLNILSKMHYFIFVFDLLQRMLFWFRLQLGHIAGISLFLEVMIVLYIIFFITDTRGPHSDYCYPNSGRDGEVVLWLLLLSELVAIV